MATLTAASAVSAFGINPVGVLADDVTQAVGQSIALRPGAVNPLVSAPQDTTTVMTGAGLAESVAGLVAGIRSQDWVEAGLGALATSLDGFSLTIDPVGTVIAWGFSWLMEHVAPLREALDRLAGDPAQIEAYTHTWVNVAQAVRGEQLQLTEAQRRLALQWDGQAALAAQNMIGNHSALLGASSDAAAGVAAAASGGALLVALVRGLVRDVIAQCLATLAVRVPMWIAASAATAGTATPVVVAQAQAVVAQFAKQITRLLEALLSSMHHLGGYATQLAARMEDIIAALRQPLATATPDGFAAHAHAAVLPHDLPTNPGHTGKAVDGASGSSGTPDPEDGPNPRDPADPPDFVELTDAEERALKQYTAAAFAEINPFLRNLDEHRGWTYHELQEQADQVSAALAKLPPHPGVTYRGVTYSDELLATYEPGTVITERGFTSTSRHVEVASGDFGGNVLMVITGKSGRDVSMYGLCDDEGEVLYDYGTEFMVVDKVFQRDIHMWVITMEEVAP